MRRNGRGETHSLEPLPPPEAPPRPLDFAAAACGAARGNLKPVDCAGGAAPASEEEAEEAEEEEAEAGKSVLDAAPAVGSLYMEPELILTGRQLRPGCNFEVPRAFSLSSSRLFFFYSSARDF